jgi:CPA2 family monovalent cation:H+ antiporter-2
MTDIPLPLIFNLLVFLSIPFVFAAAARKLRVSPVVGYIIGGLILGNLFTNVFSREIINNFAYFGIVFLLFTIGLEVNLSKITALKKFIITGGVLQILTTIVAIFLISLFFKFTLLQSFLIGVALSSSSTALVAKIIQDRGEENSFIGEIAIGILMFQNIAFIPFLIIFTSITSQTLSFWRIAGEIAWGLLEAGLIISLLFYFGRRIIPKVFDRIARTSRELFNLFVIIFIFFVTYISLLLNIPILIGVFVAGVMVAQTMENHHIFSQVRPLRDLLAILFFIFIGLNIKLGFIFPNIPQILLFSWLVIVLKAVIVIAIFLMMRFHSKTAFSLGVYLFQIDEDAFILMSTAFFNNLFSQEQYLFMIASVLLTLIVTPILIQNKDRIYALLRRMIKKCLPFLDVFIKYRLDRDESPIDALKIKNHIVICGYGRVGSYIGQSLLMANIPFIAIDYNFNIVERAKKEGVNIIYGDPADIDILDYAQVEEAMILIMALPERSVQEAIVLNAKKLNPRIFLISRVHKDADQRRMKDLGVEMIIQPEFEASLSIIKKIFIWHKLAKDEVISKIRRLKLEHGLS